MAIFASLSLGRSRQTRTRTGHRRLIRHHPPSAGSPVVLADKITGSVARTPPVQRPLARQRVVVSRRVVAYYGRIRVSRALSADLCIHATDLPPSVCSRVVPRGSPIYSACLSLRAVFHTPLDRESALDRFFPSRNGLHQFRNVSASKIPRNPIRRGALTRLQSSLHVTARQVCSPCIGQDFYARACTPFVTIGSVEYGYTGIQSIPAAGLSPARQAALWAASGSGANRR
jgi:hypothetical protein